jgi:hypothetical protein
MEFEVIDTITGFSIESGDLIRLGSGDEITVKEVESIDGGYIIRYYDAWEDECISVFVDEDEYVELLG